MVGMLSCNRQLQHRSRLACDQLRELENLSIREFQRVVLNVWVIHIDLPKSCDLVVHTSIAKETKRAVVPDFVVKGQLRPGQQADRHLGRTVMNYELGTEFPDGGEAASA